MRSQNVCLLAIMALCVAAAASAQADYVAYDDFNTGTTADALKWGTFDGTTAPAVSGGALQMNGTGVPWQGIYSTGRLEYGSVKFNLSSYSGGPAHLIGINTSEATSGSAADGLFLRDDGGALLYKDGAVAIATVPAYVSTFPATYTFVRQPGFLGIYRDTGVGDVELFSTTNTSIMPSGSMRIDIMCYNTGAAFSLDSIEVSDVPEPSAFILLCCGVVGLLAYAWRKQK